jgi:hypothetical protein
LTASGRDANFAAPWKERVAVRLSLPKIRLVMRSGYRRVGRPTHPAISFQDLLGKAQSKYLLQFPLS